MGITIEPGPGMSQTGVANQTKYGWRGPVLNVSFGVRII